MKTILLIIGLAGFTAAGSYAQDNKNCYNKPVTNNKVKPATKVANRIPANNLSRLTTAQKERNASCFSYRKNNIVVTECPGIMYDDAGDLYYNTERAYMGNYPVKATLKQEKYNGPIAPQHNVLCNKKGAAPADGNYNTPDCTAQ